MKISKLFHWLYCLVMFLPVLFIPIIAIYSHRHTIDSYEVTRDKYQVVDFNQLIEGVDYQPSSQYLYTDFNDGLFTITFDNLPIADDIAVLPSINLLANHKYYLKKQEVHSLSDVTVYYNNNTNWGAITYSSDIFVPSTNVSISVRSYALVPVNDYYSAYFNVFDLTQMFGSGNEPTMQEFDTFYPNSYYPFTLSKNELLQNGTETLNDNDIGSQFVYDTYNVVDKYFNYDKVFNFGDLYTWLQVNFFNGNAPLGFFIFWHLLIYWLLTSILWLLFDVLIYVPQLVHRWLDKASIS